MRTSKSEEGADPWCGKLTLVTHVECRKKPLLNCHCVIAVDRPMSCGQQRNFRELRCRKCQGTRSAKVVAPWRRQWRRPAPAPRSPPPRPQFAFCTGLAGTKPSCTARWQARRGRTSTLPSRQAAVLPYARRMLPRDPSSGAMRAWCCGLTYGGTIGQSVSAMAGRKPSGAGMVSGPMWCRQQRKRGAYPPSWGPCHHVPAAVCMPRMHAKRSWRDAPKHACVRACRRGWRSGCRA